MRIKRMIGLGGLAVLGAVALIHGPARGTHLRSDEQANRATREATKVRRSRPGLAAGPVHAVTFRYDRLGRLRDAAYHDAGRAIHYDYDKAGNRTRRAVDKQVGSAPPPPPVYLAIP